MVLIWTTGASEAKPRPWLAAAAESSSTPVLGSPTHQLVCVIETLWREDLDLCLGPASLESIKMFSSTC